MLERVALHQTRFRTPGVTPDQRGVVLGHKGLVLFPSLDRLVAFLRAYSEDASLDELVPSLEIRQVVTPLKTRELVLTLQAESSYRMDRVAGVARLTGGLAFTGTQRHYVKYRDATSPLGYDVQQLVDDPADLVLYHDSFQQTYSFERALEIADLVLKLTPHRLPPAERHPPERVYATAEIGIGNALVSYLFRWQIQARAGIAEWRQTSAFEDRPRRLYVLEIRDIPERMAELFSALPGVHVFEPVTGAVGVELGFRHPLALESCTSLFDEQALHLFRGDGEVTKVEPLPPFAPVRSLVRAEVELSSEPERPPQAAAGTGEEQAPGLSLPLRLAPTQEPWRRVVATVVPHSQRQWLARLLYALPPHTLSSLRMAIGGDRFYLVDPEGIEGVPLGTFYMEVATRIYVPAGTTLVPAVASTVLEELVRDRGDGHVFFAEARGEQAVPRVVSADAFAPLSRRALREVAAVAVHADRPEDTDPPLSMLEYDKARRLPLWGVPAKDEEAEPPALPSGEPESQ